MADSYFSEEEEELGDMAEEAEEIEEGLSPTKPTIEPQSASSGDGATPVEAPLGFVGGPTVEYWCKPVLHLFADRRRQLGPQSRKLKLFSACTGLWSEGMVAQALAVLLLLGLHCMSAFTHVFFKCLVMFS